MPIVYLALAASVYTKGGGGSGGGRGGGSSSGGSKGGSSSGGSSSGGSSSKGSSTTSSGRTSSGSTTGPITPRTSTTKTTTRTVTDTKSSFLGRSVFGYPSGSFYSRYYWNSYYMHYLFWSTSRPTYVYPGQTNRIGTCVSFAASEDDTGSLQIVDRATPSFPGFKFETSPYNFEDTLNFYGNATIQTSRLAIVFEGPTGSFGERLALARQLTNSTLDRDVQASTLWDNLWSIQPMMNSTFINSTISTASIDGNLFSIGDLLVYSGKFTISNGQFTLIGNSETLGNDMSSNVTLRGIDRVSVIEVTPGQTRVEIIAQGPSVLQFTGLNQTFGDNFTIERGTYSFSGRTVELNDCSSEGLSGWAIFGIVVGSIVGLIVLVLGCKIGYRMVRKTVKKKKKEPQVDTSDAFPAYDPNRAYQAYGASPANTVVDLNQPAQEVLPPFHHIHNATQESLQRANDFLAKYPPGTQQAMEAARSTANIPPSMYSSPIKITMMEPRVFADFPFYEPRPVVFMSEMEHVNGVQKVTFYTQQDCSIQSNMPLLPRPLPYTPAGNGTVDECFYQVKILRKPNHDTTIGIGFATCPYPPFRLPGWDPQSVGYHSDDGAVFLNDVDFGNACGPALYEGDTLGIGYRVQPLGAGYHTTFFFIHNGSKLPTEFQANEFHPSMLYPTIGADGEAEVEIIFGNVQEMFFPV